jgi:succinate dehydrogenase / fumarate reductase flavoprotein subunit
VIFKAPAVILATGGGGKAWRITSNSWEYTGDGLALAYLAGAELMDLEFTQFHPTGMVWPPSVRGTLVTEGVRGDGGILLNSERKRFMFGYIPERFAAETADTEEEANRWLNGDKSARRPPELLTRDVVARAINAEVKAGRGSEHGGVYLDIASRLPAEKIKRRLPGMYHQFKELAEVDITKQPMEVGPTLHYFMGGIRVDADSHMTEVPGLFAAGECAAGLHGANRLGGNSLSDLLVFGRRAGLGAGKYSREAGKPAIPQDQVSAGIKRATEYLNRESGENPFVVQDKLQDMMSKNVGIIRTKAELEAALVELRALTLEAAKVKAHSTSQYNAGWHTALDLRNLLITSEAVARAALTREESRGAHTRDDFPGEREEWVKYNVIIKRAPDGSMEVEKRERPPGPPELVEIANSKIEDLESGKVGASYK